MVRRPLSFHCGPRLDNETKPTILHTTRQDRIKKTLRILLQFKMNLFHACEVQVTFPTNLQAEQALQVLQVDAEPTDRVTKSFRLEQTNDIVSMVV